MSIEQIFALAAIAAKLIKDGRATYDQFRTLFAKLGATDDELALMDSRLTDAIKRRQDEQPIIGEAPPAE